MFQSIWSDIKRELEYGNTVTRIIIANIFAFLAIKLVYLILYFSGGGQLPSVYFEIVRFFSLSGSGMYNLTHPWGWFTHMFLHEGFWHILWNMFFLMWFGRIVGDLLGDHRIFPLYLFGGLMGAIVFFLGAQLGFPGISTASYALGASASAMAVMMAAATLAPDYTIRLLLIGDVKIKFLVFALVVLDIIGLSGGNSGGAMAHLGGVFAGWLFILQLRRGLDLSIPVNNFIALFTDWKGRDRHRINRSKMKAVHKAKRGVQRSNLDLDQILEKIKNRGMESLTDEELAFLKKASKD
jgi:membrane associated rhomboid family serine protease